MILTTDNIVCVGRHNALECEMKVHNEKDETFFVNGFFSTDGVLMTVADQSILDQEKPARIIEQYTQADDPTGSDFLSCFATLTEAARVANSMGGQ